GLEGWEPELEVAANPVGAVAALLVGWPAARGAPARCVPGTGSFTTAACAAPRAAPAAAGAALALESRYAAPALPLEPPPNGIPVKARKGPRERESHRMP